MFTLLRCLWLAYASGLFNFMLIKVLAPGYYSRQDTKTPVKYGIIAMVTNMVFNAIFAWFYGYVGLAIATALSAFVNMSLLYRGLHMAGVYQANKTLWFVIKLVVAGGLMVAVFFGSSEDMSVWLTWDCLTRVMSFDSFDWIRWGVYLISLIIMGVRLKDLKAATE